MAAQLRTAQLSLRISAEEMPRITEAAHASGATVSQFVREAVSDKCAAVERSRGADADAEPAAEGSRLTHSKRLTHSERPIHGERLTRSERLMLAAVVRHAGLGSVSAAARAAGLSWSAAKAALVSLERRGAIRRRTWVQSWRHGVRERSVWEPAMSAPGFEQLWAQARQVRLPTPAEPGDYAGPLPPQFWSLFWNHPDPSTLTLPDDAEYVAHRLLNGPSPHAALWASARLPADALRSCLHLRSTQPHTRDLINNTLTHRTATRPEAEPNGEAAAPAARERSEPDREATGDATASSTKPCLLV